MLAISQQFKVNVCLLCGLPLFIVINCPTSSIDTVDTVPPALELERCDRLGINPSCDYELQQPDMLSDQEAQKSIRSGATAQELFDEGLIAFSQKQRLNSSPGFKPGDFQSLVICH